jgi:hypothetical protein
VILVTNQEARLQADPGDLNSSMTTMQLRRQRVVAAYGAVWQRVATELSFLGLLLGVGVLELLELGRQRRGLYANGGGLGHGSAPGADGASNRLVHGPQCNSLPDVCARHGQIGRPARRYVPP